MSDTNWNKLYFHIVKQTHFKLEEMLKVEALKGAAFIALAEGDLEQACELIEKALDVHVQTVALKNDRTALLYALLAIFEAISNKHDDAQRHVEMAGQKAESVELSRMLYDMPLPTL